MWNLCAVPHMTDSPSRHHQDHGRSEGSTTLAPSIRAHRERGRRVLVVDRIARRRGV